MWRFRSIVASICPGNRSPYASALVEGFPWKGSGEVFVEALAIVGIVAGDGNDLPDLGAAVQAGARGGGSHD
jgi:hypothetical protein